MSEPTDKERLDYLEKWPTGTIEKFCDQSHGISWPWKIRRANCKEHKRPTLREAIDAAMSSD